MKKKYSLYVDKKMVYLGDFDSYAEAQSYAYSLPIRPNSVCIFENY